MGDTCAFFAIFQTGSFLVFLVNAFVIIIFFPLIKSTGSGLAAA